MIRYGVSKETDFGRWVHLQCIRDPASRGTRGARATRLVSGAVGGELYLVVHLVLDRTKETRLVLGGITTFVKNSTNLHETEQLGRLQSGVN